MELVRLELFTNQFSRSKLNDPNLESVRNFKLLDEFLENGSDYCQKVINDQPQDDDFLCGWLLWEPGEIRFQSIPLLQDLVWACFVKEMEITDWHPWDGQFSPGVKSPSLWAEGYFRYLYQTNDIQGIDTVLTCTLGYKNNLDFFIALKEALGEQKFIELVYHFTNLSKSKYKGTGNALISQAEFMSNCTNKKISEIIKIISENLGFDIEKNDDYFSMWFSEC
jgi:hypothetical protein